MLTDNPPIGAATDEVLQLHEERIAIKRQRRDTVVVTATAKTQTHEHLVSEPRTIEHVEITRVPIGRPIDACPPIRTDGDTTILSIVEEVIVITRQLVLKEEVHLTKRRTTELHAETVLLREQHAVISREPVV